MIHTVVSKNSIGGHTHLIILPSNRRSAEDLDSTRSPARAGLAAGAARLLQQLGHEAGPAGLMLSAEPGAGLAVEVLVEQDQIAKVGP